jgi:putative GTP pyrophosphokinase
VNHLHDQPSTAPSASFSKGEVNRAGKLLLDVRDAAGRESPDRAIEQFGAEKVLAAFDAVAWWRTLHGRPLSHVAANLRYHVDEEKGKVQGRTEVTQRLKRMDTIIDKLSREPTMQVTQMQDIGGVRALLPSQSHVYSVSRRLRKSWTILRVRDYIAEPKPSGYRAIHLIVQRRGYPVEVQLRTLRQDIWANQLEVLGRRIGMGLKFGAGPAEIHSYFVTVSKVFAFQDRGEPIPAELAMTVNARYAIIKDMLPPSRVESNR